MRDGHLDEESLRKLLRRQRETGTAGIVPAGCTGEAATLSFDERMRLLAVCLEEVGDVMPVIPGTGSNSTRETVRLTEAARKAGAQGALIITPYYNKPSPEGQYQHYRAVAEEVDIPIVLYNVPSRTGVSMLPETIARLAEIRNIVALKEAGGSVDRVTAILDVCDITVLSGDDPLTLPMMAVGAKGVVSVVANVLPAHVAEMVDAYAANPDRAREIHAFLWPIVKALFVETNPAPAKYAMERLGLIASGELRQPLVGITDASRRLMGPALERIERAFSSSPSPAR
jgi:4-hydroxy-tetrahydrodipicolinate synthase